MCSWKRSPSILYSILVMDDCWVCTWRHPLNQQPLDSKVPHPLHARTQLGQSVEGALTRGRVIVKVLKALYAQLTCESVAVHKVPSEKKGSTPHWFLADVLPSKWIEPKRLCKRWFTIATVWVVTGWEISKLFKCDLPLQMYEDPYKFSGDMVKFFSRGIWWKQDSVMRVTQTRT